MTRLAAKLSPCWRGSWRKMCPASNRCGHRRRRSPRLGAGVSHRLFPSARSTRTMTKVIARGGLVLAIYSSPQGPLATPEFFVHALEWLAQSCGVVALFDVLPPNEPPFERILHCARSVSDVEPPPLCEEPQGPWIAPWRGSPHPLSDIEKKMAAMLAADAELGPLFAFNRTVRTERGTLPKVDLLWTEGRFIVELDGYERPRLPVVLCARPSSRL